MLINKDDLPLVAEEFMNYVHYEDVDIINDLYENPPLFEHLINLVFCSKRGVYAIVRGCRCFPLRSQACQRNSQDHPVL